MDENTPCDSTVGDSSRGSRPSAAERWLAQNAEALESSNQFVKRHGLPLRQYGRVIGPAPQAPRPKS